MQSIRNFNLLVSHSLAKRTEEHIIKCNKRQNVSSIKKTEQTSTQDDLTTKQLNTYKCVQCSQRGQQHSKYLPCNWPLPLADKAIPGSSSKVQSPSQPGMAQTESGRDACTAHCGACRTFSCRIPTTHQEHLTFGRDMLKCNGGATHHNMFPCLEQQLEI